MIEVRNLYAGYQNKEVLKNISAVFPNGKITTIVGPNGCGKSTLLKTIANIHEKTSGKIYIDMQDISLLSSKEVAQKITYLSQSRNIPNISARRLVLHGRFPYLSYPRKYSKEDHEIADNSLKLVDAEDIADSFIPDLSGGQRQRIYIAMALAQNTQTILMDEPTSFLDINHQLDLLRLSKNLSDNGKAVVLILHDLSLALQFSDTVAVMNNGSIAEMGSPEEIYQTGIIDRTFNIKMNRIEASNSIQYYYSLN